MHGHAELHRHPWQPGCHWITILSGVGFAITKTLLAFNIKNPGDINASAILDKMIAVAEVTF